MKDLNQDNGSLEANAQEEQIKGGQTNVVSAEEENNGGKQEIDILSGFPEKKENTPPEFTDWEKSQFNKLDYMEEDGQEEVFEKYPRLREKFEERNSLIAKKVNAPVQADSQKVESELQSLKYERLIESKLSELGLTKNDLPENVKIDFIKERNELMEAGLSIEKATEKAFKLSGITNREAIEKNAKLSAMGRPNLGGQPKTGEKKAPAFTPPQKITEWYK